VLSDRTQSLIAMLASPNDGEALAACRALARVLRADGLDFHDLARGFVVREVSAPRAAAPGRADIAWLLKRGPGVYRPAEWDFLQRLNRWTGTLTPKQAAWLADIRARAGGGART
jgi:hypothetical protein